MRGGKVCDAVSRPRGAGLGGQDWWIFEPNESVLFDNFNASRLRARNVGGCVIYFEDSEMILSKFPDGN